MEILTFIRRATSLGFGLPAIRELIEISGSRSGASCIAIYEIAARQLAEIRLRIEELGRMEKALGELAENCPRAGALTECNILRVLVQPA